MMQRGHFPRPSGGHVPALWSLTLPRWAMPPSSADRRSAMGAAFEAAVVGRAVSASLMSETRARRGGDVPLGVIAAHDLAASGAAASGQFGARIRARLHRRVIDREIAGGAVVDGDPARGLRAQQLTGVTERRSAATSLRNILDAADERHADPASRVRLNHADVLAARHGIVALIEVLRSEQTVTARGVALARLLAVDRDSPMLSERSGSTVQQAVSEALGAL